MVSLGGLLSLGLRMVSFVDEESGIALGLLSLDLRMVSFVDEREWYRSGAFEPGPTNGIVRR